MACYDSFVPLIDSLGSLLTGVGTIGLAIVAVKGIHAWKYPSLAKIQTAFLEEILTTAHRFVQEVSAAHTYYEFISIFVKSYGRSGDTSPREGLVRYIEKNGSEDAKKLFEKLIHAKSSFAQLNSLVAKGQALGLLKYDDCQQGITLIRDMYVKLEAIAGLIGTRTLNMKNPAVLKMLDSFFKTSPQQLRANMETGDVMLTQFAKMNYQKIFGRVP